MEENTEQVRNRPDPAEPDQDTRPSKEAKVPPASETWVEGQPTSDADYGADEKAGE
jgi:hypothetical protein